MKKFIIIIPILLIIQLNEKISCKGLSLLKLMYNGKIYAAFNTQTNEFLQYQINYLLDSQDQ
jgi:hypothetical protein